MIKEIYNNGLIQILYDAKTGEVKMGWYDLDLTEYEKYMMEKLFAKFEYDENEEDLDD